MKRHPLKDPIFWIVFLAVIYFSIATYGHINAMNTTAKKTHIYTVKALDNPGADVKVVATMHLRAESLAQARTVAANMMLTVARATTDEILDLKRDDVIDATQVVDPKQETLPLDPVDAAVASFTSPEG